MPDPDNHRFYPDIGHNTIYVYDPATGGSDIPVHQFNLGDPMAGDAVAENATGYLMRNAQWLVQVIGVDALRIDAAKHVQGFTLDYIDRAIYRQNPRPLLDGSTQHVFAYSEVYDADPAVLHPHVKKTIDPGDIGTIGGNRDTLDFKLYFAMKENLERGTRPGWENWDGMRYAWYRIKDTGLDVSPANGQGDTLHNGNAGVTFVQSHDVHTPWQLGNVAHAYTLMMPGNTVVYFNGKELGDDRPFPKDGRRDALDVRNGSALTGLLRIRNTHGRGNYAERWIDDQGLFAFERTGSCIVLLSNRADGGRPVNGINPFGTISGVDFDSPATVTYGFEYFGDKSSPLIGPNGLGDPGWTGDGEFRQTVDTTVLEEGLHFLEARGFRHRTDDAEAAVAALEHYMSQAPFTPSGILLSDNAKAFLSEAFIQATMMFGLIQRTTKPAHPWSNGKAEAMNRTLKYQCFPAVAGNIQKWEDAVQLVQVWMTFYNTQRAHSGHINRGLPPIAFYELYTKTPGDHLDRLLAMGILKPGPDWRIRLMGRADADKCGAPLPGQEIPVSESGELPYALICDRRGTEFTPAAHADHSFAFTDAPPTHRPCVTLSK